MKISKRDMNLILGHSLVNIATMLCLIGYAAQVTGKPVSSVSNAVVCVWFVVYIHESLVPTLLRGWLQERNRLAPGALIPLSVWRGVWLILSVIFSGVSVAVGLWVMHPFSVGAAFLQFLVATLFCLGLMFQDYRETVRDRERMHAQ